MAVPSRSQKSLKFCLTESGDITVTDTDGWSRYISFWNGVWLVLTAPWRGFKLEFDDDLPD
jgi:hypothetical protein